MDQTCPRCRTTKYRNPNMKMMVNVCGHNLCESCVELLFVKGSGACPECNVALRRGNFRLQLFEDANVDKEVDIRRRILKDFNKQEEDFPTLREYNDYLEMVEDIIFNLTNNLDILETNKRILAYKDQNKEEIVRNRSRLSKDAMELEDILAIEMKQSGQRRTELQVLEQAEKAAKIKNKEKLIDELMFGERSAEQILEEHREQVAAEERSSKAFSTGAAAAASLPSTTTTTTTTDQPFHYTKPLLDLKGPGLPEEEALESCGFMAHVRAPSQQEAAGGYLGSLGCYRALQEAMAGLYYVPGAK